MKQPHKQRDFSGEFEDTLTIEDTAQLLRLNTVYLRRRVSNGGFPGAIRIGRVWRIPRSAYEAVLKSGLAAETGGAQ